MPFYKMFIFSLFVQCVIMYHIWKIQSGHSYGSLAIFFENDRFCNFQYFAWKSRDSDSDKLSLHIKSWKPIPASEENNKNKKYVESFVLLSSSLLNIPRSESDF